MQNVRKAISRYGTLPKGVRIGAYLESLRQSGMSTSDESSQQAANNNATSTAATIIEQSSEITPRSLSPRTNIRTQPQMIRSNSSGGVTTFHATHPPSSPTSSKLSRATRNNIMRNNNIISGGSSDIRSSLRTFKMAQQNNTTNNTSTFRGGSPSRSIQPSLADLEFPPPPTDLPPPPEEFDNNCCDSLSVITPIMTTSSTTELKRKSITTTTTTAMSSSSPLLTKKALSSSVNVIDDIHSDVSTLQPSVEEASSRFGVSLKKREPSTDSCNSISNKDYDCNNKEKSPQRISLTTSPSQDDGKSPISVDSDLPSIVPDDGCSSVEALPPPPSSLLPIGCYSPEMNGKYYY